MLTDLRRGMAALMGKDVKKLKAKGGGKWKYMSEQDMLDHSAKFAPYRYVSVLALHNLLDSDPMQEPVDVLFVEDRGRRPRCCSGQLSALDKICLLRVITIDHDLTETIEISSFRGRCVLASPSRAKHEHQLGACTGIRVDKHGDSVESSIATMTCVRQLKNILCALEYSLKHP